MITIKAISQLDAVEIADAKPEQLQMFELML